MKRTLMLFAAVAVLATLTACGDGDVITDAPVADAPVTSDAPVTADTSSVADEPVADTSDTGEDTGFDLPMVPV